MSSMRLTSGPIQLRLITPHAAQQVFALAREPQLSRYLQWRPHESIDDSLAYIESARSLWERRIAFLPGMFEHGGETEQLIGAIGITHIDRANRRCEVGTWIGVPFQRKGFNLYAKAAIFAMAFEVLAMHRVEILVRPENEASRGSMAKLPGVGHEGLQRLRIVAGDEPHDAHMYAITSASYDRAAYPPVTIEGALA